MDKDQLELKKSLEQQLQWSKERVRILDWIDEKLHEMKTIARYAAEQQLSAYESNELNIRLNELNAEVHALEKQLNQMVH